MSSTNRPLPQPISVQSGSASQPPTAPGSESPPHLQPRQSRQQTPADGKDHEAPPKSAYQRFVLTDPVAFRYLEEDPSTTVLERRRELHGYECYIVEQWTTSRTHPTFVITTYTGDLSHVVVVGVLSVPTDESTWSPRLRVYFKALNQYHARRKETPLGILMVTNLSGFPSSLTVIAVPGGDLRKNRFDFFVNENLKRLGCSGRVGLALIPPTAATTAKFQQLYRVSDKNDIYKSVIELVKLCQGALMLFNELSMDYTDGLLCDVTERALNEWWIDFGSEHYNLEPHDGILGATTVAGLLGLLMGARNRLNAVNAPVPKDPFDIEAMKQGIDAFQKQQRLSRTRRLDRRTLDRLHKASQKAADKEHWLVPRAVKSTVAELSGKGGEMVLDAMGRRDRAGIAEIETVDIERFAQLVYGDRCKWLWHGKPWKKSKIELLSNVSDEIHDILPTGKDSSHRSDERGGNLKTAGRKGSVDGAAVNTRDSNRGSQESPAQQRGNELEESDETGNKASMLKRATNLRNEAKSGINKVRDAVAFRGHRSKPSVDDQDLASTAQKKDTKRPLLQRSLTSPYTSPSSVKSQDLVQHNDLAAAEQSARLNMAIDNQQTEAPRRSSVLGNERSSKPIERSSLHPHNPFGGRGTGSEDPSQQAQDPEAGDASRRPSESKTVDTAILNPSIDGFDSEGHATKQDSDSDGAILLRRTASFQPPSGPRSPQKADDAFPRHLSFSLAEESVLHLDLPIHEESSDPDGVVDAAATKQLAEQAFIAAEAKHFRAQIDALRDENATWTSEQLRGLDALLQHADAEQQTVEALHLPRLDAVSALQRQCATVVAEEQAGLEEGSKGLETLLARLDYEIDGLRGKVEDVEAAVNDFEKGIERVEERVLELEAAGERGSSWSCVVC